MMEPPLFARPYQSLAPLLAHPALQPIRGGGQKRRPRETVRRPILLYLQIDYRNVMSWIKDKKYGEKDREKLEKGGGFEKFVTIISHWFYRVMSW
jgi:hypothetical protein